MYYTATISPRPGLGMFSAFEPSFDVHFESSKRKYTTICKDAFARAFDRWNTKERQRDGLTYADFCERYEVEQIALSNKFNL